MKFRVPCSWVSWAHGVGPSDSPPNCMKCLYCIVNIKSSHLAAYFGNAMACCASMPQRANDNGMQWFVCLSKCKHLSSNDFGQMISPRILSKMRCVQSSYRTTQFPFASIHPSCSRPRHPLPSWGLKGLMFAKTCSIFLDRQGSGLNILSFVLRAPFIVLVSCRLGLLVKIFRSCWCLFLQVRAKCHGERGLEDWAYSLIGFGKLPALAYFWATTSVWASERVQADINVVFYLSWLTWPLVLDLFLACKDCKSAFKNLLHEERLVFQVSLDWVQATKECEPADVKCRELLAYVQRVQRV